MSRNQPNNWCRLSSGKAVNLLLVEHFGSIVDVGFTAEMEEKLDQIEEDKVDWHGMLEGVLSAFW